MKHPAFPGLCLAVSLYTLTFNINAASSVLAAEDIEFIGMPPLIITASHIAQTKENTIASVTVISKQDIELSGAKSIADILQTVPGVTIRKSGGKGQLQSLSLRGASSKQTLILLNGQRISSATSGDTAFNLISIDHIERIEVIRGNRASIHGSDAIGGVINIITHQATEKTQSSAGASLGEEHSAAYRFRQSGSLGQTNLYGLSLSHFTTDGFDVSTKDSFSHDPDDDGYRNSSASFNFKHTFNNTLSSKLSGLISAGNTAFDNAFGGDESDFENYNISFATRYHRNNVQSTLAIGESRDQLTTFGNGISTSKGDIFSTIRRSVNWDNVIHTDFSEPNLSFNVAFGAGWYKDDVSNSSTVYNEQTRTNGSGYAEIKLDSLYQHFELGYRAEDNEQFGDFDSFNIGIQHDFCACLKTGMAYSTGFRAPTFNDLYFPQIFGMNVSNPALSPEKSQTFEINFKGLTDGIDWFISLYATKIEQAIVFDLVSFLPKNLGEVATSGQEAGIEFNLMKTRQRLSLEWTETENLDKNDPNEGKALPLTPEKALKWNISKQWQKLSLNGSLNYQGKRYTDAANTEQLRSFSTLDINALYRVHNQLKLGLRIENVFDKEYIASAAFGDFFNAQRRIAYLDLDYYFN